MFATGGYLITKRPLIRGEMHCHSAALERPVSQADLDALNAVQSTPWTINRFIHDVMTEAWRRGVPVAGIEKAMTRPVPERMSDELWAAMPREDQVSHRKRLHEIHSGNASAEGREASLLDNLTVAEILRKRPAFWYPHSRCFRGRIHPMPARGPHPQSNDIGKALLMFAEGLPLGLDGEFWLCVRAANCAGQDKLALGDRVAWTLENSGRIVAAAADPFGDLWWSEADEPWSLLATCHELSMMWALGGADDAQNFVSHLPVPMDGTCNGLQHLSAMGLDPVGAEATNLTASAVRHDIYEEVAAVVASMVEADAAAGHAEAMGWLGKVSRKTVKRAVMTTPYGVTDRGIRDQLLKDRLVEVEGSKGAAADYLKDKLVAALDVKINAGRGIMAWLQTTADRLARAGLPFEWTTPTGSRVRQAYYTRTSSRIVTLVGRVRIEEENAEATLSQRKQALGASPNFIHSFDAAHLAKTVLAAQRAGMRSFSMIHDSYGTHAANTGAMSAMLREQFVDIYKDDWLARTAEAISEEAPHVDIPDVPVRGSFDLDQVLDAPFFFS